MKLIQICSITFLLTACSDKPVVPPREPVPYEVKAPVFTVSSQPASVAADNNTTVKITATITAKGSAGAVMRVVFTTDRGVFANDQQWFSASVNADSTASVWLKSNTTGTAVVTAKVDSIYTHQTQVLFVRPLPTDVLVEADSARLTNTYEAFTAVSARFLYNDGVVSTGQAAVFYDSTINNTSVGVFSGVTTTDAAGIARAKYRLQDTSYHGIVYIKCRLANDSKLGVARILIQ